MTSATVAPPWPTPAADRCSALRGIEKSFGAVEVLRGVDLDVTPGRVTALVGDNKPARAPSSRASPASTPSTPACTFDGKPGPGLERPKDSNALGIEVVLPGPRAVRQPRRGPQHVPGPELAKADALDEATIETRAQRPSPDSRSARCARCAPTSRPVGGQASRPSPSAVRCCGTPASSSSTSPPPRWASPRPSRC